MSEDQKLLAVLRQSADAEIVDAIETLIRDAPDHDLNRINALAFAEKRGLDEDRVIAAFLHAARIGLFEMSWNVLCPGCGGVLEAGMSLKSVNQSEYCCSLCAAGYEPTLDEMVEVTFTVSPRVRKIAAHDPDTLPMNEYMRQIFWGSGIDLPEDFERLIEEIVLDAVELPAGERAILSLQLPAEFVIVFEPVTHAAQFIDVKGEPTRERQSLSLVLNESHPQNQTLAMRPGPLRISLENHTNRRVLPSVWVAGNELHHMLKQRRSFLTAKRLLTNQTFRDLYRTDTLDIDQRLKITSLTFLFTDLKGSTELYERVGDLVAYDLVREHFRVLQDIVASETGAVVKTIGDAVMATFPTPDHGDLRRSAHARGDAQPQRAARPGGPAVEDRHSRGAVPCRDAERPAGLFRPDGEHRLARPGPCHVALDLRDRFRGRASRGVPDHRDAGPAADTAEDRFARAQRRVSGL